LCLHSESQRNSGRSVAVCRKPHLLTRPDLGDSSIESVEFPVCVFSNPFCHGARRGGSSCFVGQQGLASSRLLLQYAPYTRRRDPHVKRGPRQTRRPFFGATAPCLSTYFWIKSSSTTVISSPFDAVADLNWLWSSVGTLTFILLTPDASLIVI